MQAAHLTLLCTKYRDVTEADQNVAVKDENTEIAITNSVSMYDTEENLASKHEEDTDFEQDNGKYLRYICENVKLKHFY